MDPTPTPPPAPVPDGGGAFPVSRPNGATHPGMTLRDYFAAAALTGILAHSDGCPYDEFAAAAYEAADAMLAARGAA